MYTTSEKIAKQKKVLAKAVLSSAKQLGLTQDQFAIILNLDSVKTLNSLELDPNSNTGRTRPNGMKLKQYFQNMMNKL